MEAETMDCITEFKGILRDIIVPIFKAAGFERSGFNFYRRTKDIIQTFAIQKGRQNWASNHLSFSFKVGLLSEEIYAEIYKIKMPKVPQEIFSTLRLSANTISENCKQTHTISIYRDIKPKDIASEIGFELKNYIIPFYEKYDSTDKWGALIDLKHNGVVIVPAIQRLSVLLKIGRYEEAAEVMNKQYTFAVGEYLKTVEYFKGKRKSKGKEESIKIWQDALLRIESFAERYTLALKDKK